MPMMQSPYDVQIISLSGHSPVFKAGVPTQVADVKALITECLARGVRMSDDQNIPAVEVQLDAAAPQEIDDNSEDAEAEFEAGLDKALLRILTRDDPSDLSAQLVPKVTKVTAEMSPELRRPTSTEVSDAYQRLQENIDLASE